MMFCGGCGRCDEMIRYSAIFAISGVEGLRVGVVVDVDGGV
jgi:hypothetical protein